MILCTLADLRVMAHDPTIKFDVRLTQLKPGTLRVWVHRGILTDHGHRDGQRLYDYYELLARLADPDTPSEPT